MTNSFINFCYNIAGKREIKKQREDGQYVLLSGDNYRHPTPVAPLAREEDSDSSQKSPTKKLDFINKLFKAKAKNSDDEATISSVYDQCKGNESDSSPESAVASKNDSKGVINRKKKRSLAFYDNKGRQQKKHPGLAKIRPATDKPKKNKGTANQKNEDEAETTSKASSIESVPKPVVTLVEDKERILEQFDPLWVADDKKEEKLETPSVVNDQKGPIKAPRCKVKNEKVMFSEKLAAIKIPELKVAKMEAIQENEFPAEEEIIEEVSKDAKDEHMHAKASVSYEGLEGVFARPVIHDHNDAVKEGVYPITASRNTLSSNVPNDLANTSHSEDLPVFAQPRKNPWNVWPGLFEDSLGTPTSVPDANDDSKKLENFLEEDSRDQLARLLFQDIEEEKETDEKLAKFFAEEARCLNDQDIAKYSNNIEISKIEIYEEDIKRYHQSLKYHRGPVDHDIIFTTVETALNFIQKLVKEREQRKKVGFLPELLEKCLKSKAQRQKEKEEEEKKKKEKEENKKKGPLKPKMWLVFNRLSKEKVIICTPGEFYDSD